MKAEEATLNPSVFIWKERAFLKHWMKYIKPYKAWFILGPLCMIVEVIGEVLMPMLLAGVINAGNAGTLTVGSSIGTAGLMILIALFMMGGGIGGC